MKLRKNYRLVHIWDPEHTWLTWAKEWFLECSSPEHNFYAVNVKLKK